MFASRRRGRWVAPLLTLLLGLVATLAATVPASAGTLEAGADFTCAAQLDGRVACWGAPERLGRGTASGAIKPVAVASLGNAVDVATGGAHACAVRTGGAVVCWGSNDAEQLGVVGGSLALAPLTTLEVADAVAVAAGDRHTCALRRGGTVRCWGSAARTGGGDGNGVARVAALDAGATATCAVTRLGVVSCWGALASAPALTDATAVAVGDDHACVLRAGGVVTCWGDNDRGQRGLGSTAPQGGATGVPGLSGVTALAAGGDETCALRGDRTVACWGAGDHGQIGAGDAADHSAPTTVRGVADATAVTVGDGHACALRSGAGGVVCWGDNDAGQLGNDRPEFADSPVAAVGTEGATVVSSGFGGHRCAVVTGTVKCWGQGGAGQLGTGRTDTATIPVAVPGLGAATDVAAGSAHSCAVLGDSSVRCWGDGDKGQLGDGGTQTRLSPVSVPGLLARSVAAGYHSSCAVTTAAQVACWGDRFFRGDPFGHWEQQVNATTVTGTDGAVEVAIVDYATCARFADGGVKCWGSNNDGELGIGHRGDAWHSTEPLSVLISDGFLLGGVVDLVAVDTRSVCARRVNGTIYCWGGDYGNYAGTIAGSDVPLPGNRCWLGDAVALCIGDATDGKLGDDPLLSGRYRRSSPDAVVDLAAVRQPSPPALDPDPLPGGGETPTPGGGGTPTPPGGGSPNPGGGGGTPTPPSGGGRTPSRFAILAAKPGKRGRIALTLSAPAAGSVKVVATTKLGGKRVSWFVTKKALALKPGRRVLAVVPGTAARRAFARVRSARISLRVTFTARGGKAVVRTKTVTVRR